VDGSAEAIGSVNTIVNTGGQLRAYNTDYLADYQVPVDNAFAVLGSGGMARPWWRRCATPASTLGRWLPATPGPGRPWPSGTAILGGAEVGASRPQLLVNATPVGMSGGPAADDLPVAPEVVDAAETVLDVVAAPALTPLVRRARAQGKQVITGAEVIALQAVEQFVLYTGRPPQRRLGPSRLSVLPRVGRHLELPYGPTTSAR
jgi:shikimate dehydrogenase